MRLHPKWHVAHEKCGGHNSFSSSCPEVSAFPLRFTRGHFEVDPLDSNSRDSPIVREMRDEHAVCHPAQREGPWFLPAPPLLWLWQTPRSLASLGTTNLALSII